MDRRFTGQHLPVQRKILRFMGIVEFLAQPVGEFAVNLTGIDRLVEARIQPEHQVELAEVRLHRARHVGILQLGRDAPPVERGRAVNLPERRRSRRLMLETAVFRLPVGAEFGLHPPLDERPAHRRRIGLQLAEFGGIFRRHRVGDGRDDLRNLHDRTLEPAQRRAQLRRARRLVVAAAKQPRRAHLRRETKPGAADTGITRQAAAEGIGICHRA